MLIMDARATNTSRKAVDNGIATDKRTPKRNEPAMPNRGARTRDFGLEADISSDKAPGLSAWKSALAPPLGPDSVDL